MTGAPATTNSPLRGALPRAEIGKRLGRLLSDVHAATRQQVGYPVNQDFDYSAWFRSWTTRSTTSETLFTPATSGATLTRSNAR